MSSDDIRHYFIVSPDDLRGVLEHRNKWAKLSFKAEGTEQWQPAGYISWSKTGKTLTVMISSNSPIKT